MIEYLVKYQNNYVTSFLFVGNFHIIVNKGLTITPLLESKIFRFDFDYDEWPSTHTNNKEFKRPYSQSVLKLRKHYKTIFPEPEFDDIFNDSKGVGDKNVDSSKIFKIKYSINLLPQYGFYIGKNRKYINQGIDLMSIFASSSELEIFATNSLMSFSDFKWIEMASKHHI